MTLTQERSAVAIRVGHNVRIELAKKRWSVNRAAGELGLTQTYLSRRITGALPFDVDDLAAIAGLLDIDAGDFMRRVMESTDSMRSVSEWGIDVRTAAA